MGQLSLPAVLAVDAKRSPPPPSHTLSTHAGSGLGFDSGVVASTARKACVLLCCGCVAARLAALTGYIV